MKCLICKTYPADKSLNDVKSNYPCFCFSYYWNEEYDYEDLVKVLQKHLQTMPELKFPTDEDYPEGFTWFAYDQNGVACWYEVEPYAYEYSNSWHPVTESCQDWECANKFTHNTSVACWKETLRKKGQSSLVEHPNHYTWLSGIECKDVTSHFNFNIGNIIKYAWRVGNPQATKHQTVDGLIEDLNKIKMYAEFEIERLKSNERTSNP